MIGVYPTPVERISGLSAPGTELWVKRDDLTGEVYGGNKVRKLEHILEAARARGAERIVTLGAAGSHHVLATTVYGRRAGFRVAAVLTPQPRTDHAVDDLRAGLALGLEAHAAPRFSDVPLVLARTRARGDYLIPPGGSNVVGSVGYIDGAAELARQVREGALPCPDLVVVALGSGGTAAGLLAGLARERLETRVLGVRIVEPLLIGKVRTVLLARGAARIAGARVGYLAMGRRLEVDSSYLGRGYGHPTEAGNAASAAAHERGLELDPTYTAKAFAAALDRARAGVAKRILFWHTLSSAPLEPLLRGAPTEKELPRALRTLFV